MQDCVKISVADGIAEIRLNRPEKMNAVNDALIAQLDAAGRAVAQRNDVRAVVLSGEGRAFCAGLDMAGFSGMAEGKFDLAEGLHRRTHGIANQAQHICIQWLDIPVPVIAAVHGVAFGAGFQIMLGADIRIVAPDARLSVMEIKWGLVPDMGGFALMRRILRDDVARELTFTGRQFSGEEAKELGVATKVAADPHAEAMATARQIAGSSPDAVRAAKRLFNIAAGPLDSGLMLAESLEQQKLIGSANQLEAIAANMERRPPHFADPANV